MKNGTKMFSSILGGGQENGLRSGTENTPFISGIGEAVRIKFSTVQKDFLHMKELREYCTEMIVEQIPKAVLNSNKQGSPHIVNFSLPGLDNRKVVEFLDSRDIFISSAAACKSKSPYSRGPSVLESLGVSRSLADSALRISFSHLTTKSDIDTLLKTLVVYCSLQNGVL
ncbi:Aminotransferase class-V [Bacillus sp. OK048]|nr:Aminotransferase class-V [Bacillus sp. OK048]